MPFDFAVEAFLTEPEMKPLSSTKPAEKSSQGCDGLTPILRANGRGLSMDARRGSVGDPGLFAFAWQNQRLQFGQPIDPKFFMPIERLLQLFKRLHGVGLRRVDR